jgi:phosphoribosylformylglycinamidine synthase
MRPKTLVLRTAGTNCDAETAHAFEQAGATAEFLHVNRLLENPGLMDAYQLMALPGGFSYGDDIAAGRIFANQIVHHLRDAFQSFIAAGKPIIGICNGFQVLLKTDLLPGPLAGRGGQNCTLAHNDSGRFIDRWIRVGPRSAKCIWTAGLEPMDLPIAHGEGKFVPADESVRKALWENDQVALIYVDDAGQPARAKAPANPNGSVDDIAGVCDATGLVLGLMPHPERFTVGIQHPSWTRNGGARGAGAGLAVFENAVQHVVNAVGAGV